MTQTACVMPINSFELQKTMTFSKILSKEKLTPTARLVLRCLADFWNPDKGLMFPGQKMIAECTGATERSVIKAIEELRQKGIILTVRSRSGLTYYFTKKLFEILGIKKGQKQKFQMQKKNFCPGKKFISKPEENSLACIEQKREQIGMKKSKILNFEKSKEPKYLSPAKTKERMQKKFDVETKTPEQFTEDEAYKFCTDMPKFLRSKSEIYKKLVEKWNFEELKL